MFPGVLISCLTGTLGDGRICIDSALIKLSLCLTGVSLLLLYPQLHFCSILSVLKAESGFYICSH